MESLFDSNFAFDDTENEEPKICVVGIGGAGGNAVNNMIRQGIDGVEFYAINTDAQALAENLAPHKIQAGVGLTKGDGAGARPARGAQAVEENRAEIEKALAGFDMIFVTAGMGGGTGTGGAPIVASIARELGILSVAIVTRPFECEGRRRAQAAETGLEVLRKNIDTLIIIPNERLLDISDADTTLVEAFEVADDVLYNATRGISDLITVHGLINLDFADVKTTMQNGGDALMGAATSNGENRAERAAKDALSSPLLDGISIRGATNVLVNITAGPSLGIREATAATGIVQHEAGDDVEVIFGTVIDESMGEDFRITVIATGFKDRESSTRPAERKSVPLQAAMPVYGYKGEENLKHLDEPAYLRRGQNAVSTLPAGGDGGLDTKVRRLNADDVEDIESDPKGDDDMPAFLRKMMD